MKKILLALLFATFASIATAATTTNISGGGPGVLSAAITAAAAGDTINITDSATYTETALSIAKVIYITADPGQTPIITNSGALTANTFVTFAAGCGGTTTANCTKFGSLSGGRITIQYQTQATPAFADAVIRFKQGTSLHAILENVNIIETGTNVKINGMMHNYTTKDFITLNYVDIDLGATTVLNFSTASTAGFNQAAGIMCPSDMNNYSNSQEVYNLNHVRIKNFGTVGICAQNIQCVLNMSYCDIGTLGAKSNNSQWPAACIFNRHPAVPFTAKIDRCIFRAPAVGCAVNFGGGATASAYTNPTYGSIPPYTSVTLTRSVFVAKYPEVKTGHAYLPGGTAGTGPVLFYPSRSTTTWAAIRPQSIHFDHCDIVDMTTGTYTNVAAIARPALAIANWATSLTLTNSNMYSANNAGLKNLAAATSPFSLAEDHNNWYSSQANSPATNGLNLDPGYLYPEAGDVRYTNATLKTADALGGPIGVNAAYFDAVNNIETTKLGLRYLANPLAGGTIDGGTSETQNIASGDTGTEVTAAPNAHYTFTGWSDSVPTLARTDGPITNNQLLLANFLLDTYTVDYVAGANGTCTGTLSQTIGWNLNGTPVTAIPNTGYHFTQWEDALTSNPRTDFNVTANASHTASFAINQYTRTYVADANGTIDGSTSVTQTVNHGDSSTLVNAIPEVGYHFVQWDDGILTAARTDANVTGSLTVTASFAINQYSLTYTPGAGGTITGVISQTVDHGTSGTEVTAVADPNYHFTGWSDGVLTAARTDTNVAGPIDVTANFTINTYQVQYVVSAFGHGSITGQATQTINYGGSTIQVTATPESGYHFKRWAEDLSTNASRTDSNITADATFTAEFEEDQAQYTLTYTAGTGGTISGVTPQTVTAGTSGTTVTAVPDAHYHFVKWSDNVMTAARTDTNINASIDVTAEFAIDQVTLKYIAGANGSIDNASSVTLSIDYGTSGSAVTAVPATGYHFTQWDDASTSNPRIDTTVTTNVTVTASFEITTYTLHYIPGSNGFVIGDTNQTVDHGTSGTAVTAQPAAHYHFVQWTDGSTQNPRTDTNVQGDISVGAVFSIDTVTLHYIAESNGSIDGNTNQIVDYGTNGSAVTATPSAHYHFVQWSDGSTQNPRTDLDATANVTVSASFAIDTFTLTYAAGANGSLNGSASQTVDYNANGTAVTANPAEHYHFVKWSDNVTANPRTELNVSANVSVTAEFALDTFTLSYTAGSNGSIVGTLNQSVGYGLNGTTVTAVPADGYHFVKWSDDLITAERCDENVTANLTVTAIFATGRNAAHNWAAYE